MLAIWIETKTWNVPTWLHTWWQHSLTPISKEILASYDVVLYKNGKSAPLSRTMMAIWPEKNSAWLHGWWQHNPTPTSEDILASYDVVPSYRTMMAMWLDTQLDMVARLMATLPHIALGGNR